MGLSATSDGLVEVLLAVIEFDCREMNGDLPGGLKIVDFDINPFAVLMARANYAAQIIPLYIHQTMQAQIVEVEADMNSRVADYYGLNAEDRQIVTDFLARF